MAGRRSSPTLSAAGHQAGRGAVQPALWVVGGWEVRRWRPVGPEHDVYPCTTAGQPGWSGWGGCTITVHIPPVGPGALPPPDSRVPPYPPSGKRMKAPAPKGARRQSPPDKGSHTETPASHPCRSTAAQGSPLGASCTTAEMRDVGGHARPPGRRQGCSARSTCGRMPAMHMPPSSAPLKALPVGTKRKQSSSREPWRVVPIVGPRVLRALLVWPCCCWAVASASNCVWCKGGHTCPCVPGPANQTITALTPLDCGSSHLNGL